MVWQTLQYLRQLQILKTCSQETLSKDSDIWEKLQEKPKTSITKDVKILLKKNQVIEKMLEHTQSIHVFQWKDVEDYTKL